AYDHLADGIETELITKFYDGEAPSLEKHWGQLDILGKPQEAGQIEVYPTVGYPGDAEQPVMLYDMTRGRHTLDRLGRGMFMRLRLRHTTWNEPVQLYGMEVPFNVFGKR